MSLEKSRGKCPPNDVPDGLTDEETELTPTSVRQSVVHSGLFASETLIWFENVGCVGHGLKTGGVVGPGLKTVGVVGPKNSTDGGT